MAMRYYIIQAYSGYEAQVRTSLQERVKNAGMLERFGEILVPSEEVQVNRGGKSRTEKRRFYPGYVFVEMEMNEQTWHLVKETPKVTGFIGNQDPTPVPEREIKAIRDQMEKGTSPAAVRANFEVGEQVRVVSGAFANFSGTVEEVKAERQKIKVIVPIFGRPTPVELGYNEVEKITA
ncbi:MAG: transcription termination/antitermination protein NusG [Deltaproteobacteria bacterium]|nr:transcription termination/antitermination protein NusG [Deltaproteobacteria bacterium]